MNLGKSRIVLRRRDLGESFDLALVWCTHAARGLYLRLAAWTLLPALVACVAARELGGLRWPLIWLLAVALATPIQGVFTIAVGRSLFEPRVRARDVLRAYFGRLPSYLAALLLTRIWLGLAAMLLVALPWWWPQVVYVHEASLLELHGPWAAQRRARAFVSEQYLDTLGLIFGSGVATAMAMHLADMVDYVLLDFTLQLGRPLGNLMDDGGSVFALLGFFASIPFVATVRFLRYIDARTRRDGWDIQFAFLARAVELRSQSREVA